VWRPDGSPLAVFTAAQASGLEARLSSRAGHRVPVVVGMRYGESSIASAVESLRAEGVDRILAFSMFPQYASATTGSCLERLFQIIGGVRVVPSVRIVPPYFADRLYIDSVARVARETIDALPTRPDRIVLSFHGLPKRYAVAGDPYPQHCEASAHALESALNLAGVPVSMVYQSRFGREEWLQPYLADKLPEYGRAGERIAVLAPGFTADCVETLEELGLRESKTFLNAGGRSFDLVPCLNDHPVWLDAMTTMAERELSGWV
jgi:ferrochelatase